jgi:hypothetical protein
MVNASNRVSLSVDVDDHWKTEKSEHPAGELPAVAVQA